ncbi:MAG: Rpn family recombination-promoting nuclease/putative transposase, partial [Spirochaetales bacterium]|nr:Rpn family recombination-promoting nuclease/putative transposase [Spirochaetales bacterium]
LMNTYIAYEGTQLLPPTSDVVFKAVFANVRNKDLLSSLLQAYLSLDIAGPEDIEIVNPEKQRRFYSDKLFRLDIRVKTASGDHVDVEVQVINRQDIVERSLYYVSTLYVEQMRKSMEFSELGRAVGLNILCYTIDEEASFLRSYILKERESGRKLTDRLELVFLELPKAPTRRAEGLKGNDLQEKWTAFLKAESEEELKKLRNEDELFAKAVETLVYVSEDEKIRFMHDQERKARLDYLTYIKSAKREATREGREEGLKEGHEEGRKEGLKEGSTQEKYKIAEKLLLAGMDITAAAEITGLPVEEIRKISKN